MTPSSLTQIAAMYADHTAAPPATSAIHDRSVRAASIAPYAMIASGNGSTRKPPSSRTWANHSATVATCSASPTSTITSAFRGGGRSRRARSASMASTTTDAEYTTRSANNTCRSVALSATANAIIGGSGSTTSASSSVPVASTACLRPAPTASPATPSHPDVGDSHSTMLPTFFDNRSMATASATSAAAIITPAVVASQRPTPRMRMPASMKPHAMTTVPAFSSAHVTMGSSQYRPTIPAACNARPSASIAGAPSNIAREHTWYERPWPCRLDCSARDTSRGSRTWARSTCSTICSAT